MRVKLRLFALLILSLVAFQFPLAVSHAWGQATPAHSLVGRWKVKFSLRGVGENNLLFEAKAQGVGSFQLLDTGPDKKPVAELVPSVWSETTNDRISFSGNFDLQLGECCRELGTVIFKGKFLSNDSISGKAIYVGTTVDEENFNGYRSTVGDFTAVRVTSDK